VQATIANPKHLLLPGMFANAIIDVGEKQRYLTLPQTAITYNPYGSIVFIVKPATAKGNAPASPKEKAPAAQAGAGLEVQQAFVITGDTRGDQVAITKGLKEGQTVVTSGQIKLKNGSPVVVDNKVQPANNPNPTPQEQ
jgi:membrane fusion protein (multidrug efflux system)